MGRKFIFTQYLVVLRITVNYLTISLKEDAALKSSIVMMEKVYCIYHGKSKRPLLF